MLAAGLGQYRPTPRDAGREMVLGGYLVRRDRIPEYLTPDALSGVELWRRYRLFGMPFAGGWAEQPAVVLDVLETLEAEAAKKPEEVVRHAGKR